MADKLHPLLKNVKLINSILKNNYEDITITFKEKLEWLNEHGFSYLANIFTPLIINEYNGLTLFKYENYIVLNDMGYGSDFFEIENGLYRHCRSIVIDTVDEYIALASFDKFKNFDEDIEGDWSKVNILNIISESMFIDITNKLDGSYQQYSFDKKRNCIIGSGSSALDTNQSWRLKKGYSLLDENYRKMIQTYPDLTFIFEFIAPENQIVVHYTKEQEGLYLIGAKNKNDLSELNYFELEDLAKKYNIKITECYYNETLASVLSQKDKFISSEKEGWVFACWLESKDEPFRFKLKVDDYVLIHKALSRMVSSNAIIESIIDEKFDDFYAKVPDNYKEVVDNIKNDVFKYIKIRKYLIKKYCHECIKELGENSKNRKDMMILINTKVPKELKGNVREFYLRSMNYDILTEKDWLIMNIVKHPTSKTPGHIKYGEIVKYLKEHEDIPDDI